MKLNSLSLVVTVDHCRKCPFINMEFSVCMHPNIEKVKGIPKEDKDFFGVKTPYEGTPKWCPLEDMSVIVQLGVASTKKPEKAPVKSKPKKNKWIDCPQCDGGKEKILGVCEMCGGWNGKVEQCGKCKKPIEFDQYKRCNQDMVCQCGSD